MSIAIHTIDDARVPEPRRLMFLSGRPTFFVQPDHIRWIEAEGNYCRIHTTAGAFLVRDLIGSLQTRLAPMGFIRVHRCAAVNASCVLEIRRVTRHRQVAVLNYGAEVPLSPEYRDELESYLT